MAGGRVGGLAGWVTVAKVALFVVALIPLGKLAYDAFYGAGLGAEPIREIQLRTGWWTLTLLMVTLAITPVRRFTHWNVLIKFRRMVGLFAFFYGVLHLSNYIGVDQFFEWKLIGEDIAKRPWITIGMTALVLMIPLAITSTQGMVRRLGGKRWAALHRLVYISAGCGVLHFLWLVKSDTTEPTIFGYILVGLLALRLWFARAPAAKAARATSPTVPANLSTAETPTTHST